MTTKQEWGGRREGAGRKATWKSGPCKPVKLPVALVEEVVRYARGLDAGEVPPPTVTAVGDPLLQQRFERLKLDLHYTRQELEAVKAELAEHERTKQETPAARAQQALVLLRAGLEEKEKKGLEGNIRTAIALLGGEVPTPSARRSQLMELVDEKIELGKQIAHLQGLLAQKNKKLLYVEDRERRSQASMADARSVLRAAYGDGRGGSERKPLLAAMRSALLALGLDVDR